jgi:exonuclease SbcD
MRLAVIADTHIDQHSRLGECERLLDCIHAECERRKVDGIIHTGDVFERKSTPLERRVAASWVQRMAGIAPFVIVKGNHDADEDLPLLARLESDFPIIVVETVAVVEIAGAQIACMGWPRKSALLAAAGIDSREGGAEVATEALRNVLRGLGEEMRAGPPGPRLLAMHAMVRDSVTSTGQPLVGCDFEIGLEDLALVDAHAYLLGHVHKHQAWRIGSAPCIYPGSSRRSNFGELEDKGFVILDFADDGTLLSWEFVELPATPMHHVDDEWRDGEWLAGAHGLPESCVGTEIRFRYRVRGDQRAAARAAAERWRADWLAEGAITVKLDEQVILEQRTRADVVPAQAPLADKVAAYWAAKKIDPGERRAQLLGKLAQVEEVVRAA